jgi:hypothetical protein
LSRISRLRHLAIHAIEAFSRRRGVAIDSVVHQRACNEAQLLNLLTRLPLRKRVGGDAPGLVAGEEVRRRAASRFILAIDVGKGLPVGVADDEGRSAPSASGSVRAHSSSGNQIRSPLRSKTGCCPSWELSRDQRASAEPSEAAGTAVQAVMLGTAVASVGDI